MSKTEKIVIANLGMELVLVQPGIFRNLVGANVEITYPFYIGVTEVTSQQFQALTGGDPLDGTQREVGINFQNYPIVNVTYREARKFCRALSELPSEKRAGRKYRLPREAEWEYACRAGQSTRYFWGDSEEGHDRFAWTFENSGGLVQPVKKKEPNPWGLFDMYGNVWEMTEDYWGEYPAFNAVNPKGPFYDDLRVMRGGCCSSTW